MFGCKPGSGLLLNSHMVKDLKEHLISSVDITTGQLLVTSSIRDMKGKDANFEMDITAST